MSPTHPHPDWKAVLFDLDGTLADTVPLILRCYRHMMLTHRGVESPDELWVRTIGRPLRSAIREFAHDDEEAARMLDTYIELQREVHDDMVSPFPGAAATLDILRGRGIKLALVTSKGREMTDRTLGKCDLASRLDAVVTVHDVQKGKPDPEPVFTALQWLGVEPGPEVLFVGDSPHDLVAGRAAGVLTAAAVWGPFTRAELEAEGPDHWLSELSDVLALRPATLGRSRG